MAQASPSAATAAILVEERDGAILTLRMNRPERLNALNVELGRALAEALRRAAKDETARVVVLTGAGRGFCAGGDLEFLRDARSREAGDELEMLLRAAKEICLTICDMPKPVLAAVNGPAAGGGMNLALACDLRIASERASFGESFAKLGLFPDFGGTYYLPRLVGPAKAGELFYSGEMIAAGEAERLGIVNLVAPQEKFEEETRRLAARLAAAPPLAARAVKRRLAGAERDALERALDEENRQQIECFRSEDCKEGLSAFFDKRKPVFRGR